VSPTWPDPVKIRSAIVIVEMEDGSTMQAILTPTVWQRVEVGMEVEYERNDVTLGASVDEPVWAFTVTAGGYAGQLRTAGATAEQTGPREVEP
jgi:hypothetical protein